MLEQSEARLSNGTRLMWNGHLACRLFLILLDKGLRLNAKSANPREVLPLGGIAIFRLTIRFPLTLLFKRGSLDLCTYLELKPLVTKRLRR